MKEQLVTSGSKFARSGIKAFLEEDWEVFLLHSATALEHLCKAFLADIHPSLIASGDLDSLLHACGQGNSLGRSLAPMKTIGSQVALDRCGEFLRPLGQMKAQLRVLIDARNGVVHLGIGRESHLSDRAFRSYLEAASLLLVALKVEPALFWGEVLGIVEGRLAKEAEESKTRVNEKVGAAQLRFNQRFGALPSEQREAMLATLGPLYANAPYDWSRYENVIQPCPACRSDALVSGDFDLDWHVDQEQTGPDEWSETLKPELDFFPALLNCHACGLRLEGSAELTAAGVRRSWRLVDVDPRDFDPTDYLRDSMTDDTDAYEFTLGLNDS